MSLRFNASDAFVFRGFTTQGPWNVPVAAAGGAIVTQPNHNAFTYCGLFYRHATSAGVFETHLGVSNKAAGRYHFFGKDGANVYGVDPEAGSNGTPPLQPPLGEWLCYMVEFNSSAGLATFRWCRPGDASWDFAVANDRTGTKVMGAVGWVPVIMLFGADEWGASLGVISMDNTRGFSDTRGAAATLAEVQSPTVVDPTNLFAWWKMRADGLLVDASGNDRHLLAVGAVIAGADSPLEAPGDTPEEAFAVGLGVARGAIASGSASAPANALGLAVDRRVAVATSAANAGGPTATGLGIARPATATGTASVLASGVGLAVVRGARALAGLASTIASAAGFGVARRAVGRGVATSTAPEPPVDTGVIRRRSAMLPLQIAIDERLQAWPAFTALVGDRVYSMGTVPKEPAAPYVELGESAERAAGVFMNGGNAGEETLTIVTPARLGKPGVGAVYAAMMDALDGRALAISGHRTLNARLELITIFPDPDTAHLRAVCRLEVASWTNA